MTQVQVATIDPSQSVASIALAHSECGPQFQRWRIDFCCKGEQSLQSASQARSLTEATVVDALSRAISERASQEEQEVFPMLLGYSTKRETSGNAIGWMKAEHLAVGELLGQLPDESDEFSIPDWGCTSYRTLSAELERLELDILQHVHLENHVLAPRFE